MSDIRRLLELEQHPLSAAFPSMSDDEIDALAEDIKKHGQRQPGVCLDGMVLDGWHRYLACERVGTPFDFMPFDGKDPVAFVLSKNLHRRHLTASQRAACIVAATNWRPQGRPEIKQAPGAGLSQKEMARTAEVSERTIRHAKEAHRAGLGDAVKEGKLSAKRAAASAKPEKPKPTDKSDERIKELEADLADMTERRDTLAMEIDSLKAFRDETDFKEMQILRHKLRAVERARDDALAKVAAREREIKALQAKLKKVQC